MIVCYTLIKIEYYVEEDAFMLEYMPYVWTLTLILCVLMEAATAALTAIWFMPAGFICLLLSLWNVPFHIQIIVYVAVSALTLVTAKLIMRKRTLEPKRTHTNADRLIGGVAVVTVKIDNTAPSGEVTVSGQVWTARSEGGEVIAPGEKVTVLRIEGVKLIVARRDRKE